MEEMASTAQEVASHATRAARAADDAETRPSKAKKQW
jgi:methyl-accepting chemotaxis protein